MLGDCYKLDSKLTCDLKEHMFKYLAHMFRVSGISVVKISYPDTFISHLCHNSI